MIDRLPAAAKVFALFVVATLLDLLFAELKYKPMDPMGYFLARSAFTSSVGLVVGLVYYKLKNLPLSWPKSRIVSVGAMALLVFLSILVTDLTDKRFAGRDMTQIFSFGLGIASAHFLPGARSKSEVRG